MKNLQNIKFIFENARLRKYLESYILIILRWDTEFNYFTKEFLLYI
jgi:hypothetical protein